VVTAREATVLYALSPETVKSILKGDVCVVCDMKQNEFSCTNQEVISVKPFRLKRLEPELGKWTYAGA